MRLLLLLATSLLSIVQPVALSADEFAAKSIDLGIVVADIQKSVDFYTKAIGMKEVQGFSVPGDFCREAGLTDGKRLDVRVLVLGEGSGASKIKLMQIEGVTPQKPKNEFIHSTFGFSYLTLGVTDTSAAVARLQKAGIKTIKKTPLPLPAPLPSHIMLTMVRDPDGNLIELVGPKK